MTLHDRPLNGAILVAGPPAAVKDLIGSVKELASAKGVRVLLARSSSAKFWLGDAR